MTRLVTVSWGSDQFRFGPWHVDPSVAYVVVAPKVATPTADGVRLLVDRLRTQGYVEVITAALRDHEVAAFADAGFRERERLVVLSHDLRHLAEPPPVATRRARRRDRDAILAIDAAAFEPAWRLDADGLRDAIDATPHARFRLVGRADVAGYAICGRAGRVGYLQRVAVDPEHQGGGNGRALVLDALRWLRRRGGEHAMVNTQRTNVRALDLYRRLGFRTEPTELTVLSRELP